MIHYFMCHSTVYPFIKEEKKVEEKKTFIQRIKAAGPAAVITSAFIGPGTITTATNAGVNYGYALLWAVVFSGIALVIIMNMASRLAIIGKSNIIDASISLMPNSNVWKVFVMGLIALVVILTGFGFEAGNLIGATTGFADILGIETGIAAAIMGTVTLAAIIFTTPKIIELIMKVFVALMGIIFVATAVIVGPNWGDVLSGLVPSIPTGSMVTTIALIGTTIIAINLVFHSIASADKWTEEKDLEDSYFDTKMNVSLGVLMTLGLIVTTGAVLFGSGVGVTPITFAQALEPTLGSGARIFAATGLVLAGLSSSIATPYMVGFTWARIFKWDKENDIRPKLVAGIIVVFGTTLAILGKAPLSIILFAQATSGVFLPFVAILFVIASNSKKLGKFKNTVTQNALGAVMVIVMFLLGGRTILNVISKLFS